jgi:hypothetical protein
MASLRERVIGRIVLDGALALCAVAVLALLELRNSSFSL